MRGTSMVPALLSLVACGGHVDPSATFATPSTAARDAGVTQRAAAPTIPVSWTRIDPRPKEPFPGPLARPSLVFAAPSKTLLLFGARVGMQPEVWQWERYTTSAPSTPGWTDDTPNPLPLDWPSGTSFGAPAIYDSGRRSLVVAGLGTVEQAAFGELVLGGRPVWQDAFRLSTADWASGCVECALAYDPSDGFKRQFATVDREGQTGAWKWDADTARMVRLGQPLPGARASHMIYDSVRHTPVWINVVDHAPDALIEIWTWDGSRWLPRKPAADAPWPPTRDDFRVAFDPHDDRILLMGGTTRATPPKALSDLWSYDLATGVWSELRPAPGGTPWPEPRAAQGMCVDDGVGALYVYGGDGAGGPLGDFWAIRLR